MENPHRVHPMLVMLVVGVGTLLSAMAGSAVTLALPRIGREFEVSIGSAGWVLEAYLLAVTSLLLLAGRASDAVGHRVVYLVGFAWFGLASTACGFANNLQVLVAGRIFQGVGGAMLMATAPALLTTAFPPNRRGFALGTVSTATYIGLTVGPPLGGFLVTHVSWRWVFFINAPSALVVVALGAALLPRPERTPGTRWDLEGTVTLLAGLPLALIAIDQGHNWGWLSLRTLTAAAGGMALLVLFVLLELRSADPLLQVRLFHSRELSCATVSAVGNYVGVFVAIILTPYYLTEGLGLTSSRAGLLLSIQPVVMAFVASPSGRLSDRIGTRSLSVAGLLVFAAGLAGLSTVGPATEPVVVAAWLAVMGLGTGVFISPNSSALMGAAPNHQQGVAAGVLAVGRNLGMMAGVAVAMTVFSAAGGRTARAWTETEYHALRLGLLIASGVALLSAVASAMRAPGNHSHG